MTSIVCSHGKPVSVRCRACVDEGLAKVPDKRHVKPPKQHKCKECGTPFVKNRPFETWCSPECGYQIAMKKRKADEAKQERARRKETREKLQSIKTYPQLIKEAQTAFNAWIRARDYGKPCISSGKPMDWSGNGVDAGHYRSRGSAPHLRFDERNCHAQSKHDNRYASGNVTNYRLGLIQRYGLAFVEELEADQTPRNYTREDLIKLAAHYRAKLRDMRRLSKCP